jgi:hypothetical protein
MGSVEGVVGVAAFVLSASYFIPVAPLLVQSLIIVTLALPRKDVIG